MVAFFQGKRFDPNLPQTLRLEFAKSNTKMTSKSKQQQQHHLQALTTAAALQLPQLATVNHPTIIPTLPPGSQCIKF
jgi:hypothetical protein